MKKKNLLLSAVATIGFVAATMAQSVPSYVPTNGLVGWWPFNGNANDESGNGNNGTVNGATLAIDRFNIPNKSYEIDGVNCPNPKGISLPAAINNSNAYSISVWYKTLDSTKTDQTIINSFPHQYIAVGFNYPYNSTFNNKTAVFYGNSTWLITGLTINWNTYNLNNWKNIVLVKSTIELKFYQNGTLVFTQPLLSNYNSGSFSALVAGAISINGGSQCYETFKGLIDDIGIWNRALTQQEISDLYNGVNCSNNLTVSPSNNNLATGSQANFTATTSDPNPSFVWQSDFGQGFQTLNNYGNYSGVNSSSLSISNVQLANHNQPIRAISTSGNCIDTSNVAMIMISDTCINTINDTNFITVTDTLIINATITGINPPNNQNTIKVFPNPASTHITINYGNFASMNGYQLKITNALSQQVFNTNITQQSDYIDLSTWSGNGVYFVHLIDPQGQTVDIRKIVLQ